MTAGKGDGVVRRRGVLLIMAKQAIPGASKTRLSPVLSPVDAAELSRCFVLDTIELATAFATAKPGIEVRLAGAPADSGPWFAGLAPGTGFVAQVGRRLGDRLDHAMTAALGEGNDFVLAINSDSPTLPMAALDEAVDRLADSDVDVVLGPARDGGYYLIGWKGRNSRMVREVEMSTGRVLDDTMAIAAEDGLRVALCQPWYDVDEPDDLRQVRADLDAGLSCGRHTADFLSARPELGEVGDAPVMAVVPALNEAANISSLVAELRLWVDAVVVVDNGSTDGTGERAAESGAIVVREARRGYGYACAAGSARATELGAAIVVYVDGDHSSVPSEIGLVVDPIRDGRADLVLGSRSLGRAEPGSLPAHQRFGNWLAAELMGRLYQVQVTDLGPFRAVTTELLTSLEMTEMTFGWPTEMMVKAAKRRARILEVPVTWRRRRYGRSKVSGTIRGSVLAGWHILGVTIRHADRRTALAGSGRRGAQSPGR